MDLNPVRDSRPKWLAGVRSLAPPLEDFGGGRAAVDPETGMCALLAFELVTPTRDDTEIGNRIRGQIEAGLPRLRISARGQGPAEPVDLIAAYDSSSGGRAVRARFLGGKGGEAVTTLVASTMRLGRAVSGG